MSRFAAFFALASIEHSNIEPPSTVIEKSAPADLKLAGKLGLSLVELETLDVHHRKLKIWRDVHGFTRMPTPGEWATIDLVAIDEAAAQVDFSKENESQLASKSVSTRTSSSDSKVSSAHASTGTMPASIAMQRSGLDVPLAVAMERSAAVYTPYEPEAVWGLMKRPAHSHRFRFRSLDPLFAPYMQRSTAVYTPKQPEAVWGSMERPAHLRRTDSQVTDFPLAAPMERSATVYTPLQPKAVWGLMERPAHLRSTDHPVAAHMERCTAVYTPKEPEAVWGSMERPAHLRRGDSLSTDFPSAAPMERRTANYTPQKPEAVWGSMERPAHLRGAESRSIDLVAPPVTARSPVNEGYRAAAKRMQQRRNAKAAETMPEHIKVPASSVAMVRSGFVYTDDIEAVKWKHALRLAAMRQAQLFAATEKALAPFKKTRRVLDNVCPADAPVLYCPSGVTSGKEILSRIDIAFPSGLYTQSASDICSPIEAETDNEDDDAGSCPAAPPNTPVIEQEGANPSSGALGLSDTAPRLIGHIVVARAFQQNAARTPSPTERSSSGSESPSPPTPAEQRAMQELEYREERQAVLFWRLEVEKADQAQE